jgi:hypothetical protein
VGSLTWHFSLEAGASLALDAWLRLPDSASSLTLEALIQTGTAPEYADHRALTLELQPHPRPGLDEARQAMTGEAVFVRPLKLLDKAADRLSAGDLDKALQHTLEGARALAGTRDPRAAELRHWVGNAVAETAAALATEKRE